ncbi:MAG: hypothetical protein IPN96_22560 [Anaerolineales bacterium]|nr:hypothetical protein [Anaerolineales bacterium]
MKELSNGIGEKNTGLYFTPNKNARPASLESFDHSVNFHGYQEYSLSKNWIHVLPTDASLQKKFDLLLPFFQPRFLQNRTLLDLGANAAFYCFWALQQKAQKATAVDIDEEYLLLVKKQKNNLALKTWI